MIETLLVESETIPRIDFPIAINIDTFRALCRNYILEHSGFEEKREINLYYEVNERMESPQSESAISIDNVNLTTTFHKINGRIRNDLDSASFSLRDGHYTSVGILYTGLNFDVAPGYKAGDLSSDNVELMREFGTEAKRFFDIITALH